MKIESLSKNIILNDQENYSNKNSKTNKTATSIGHIIAYVIMMWPWLELTKYAHRSLCEKDNAFIDKYCTSPWDSIECFCVYGSKQMSCTVTSAFDKVGTIGMLALVPLSYFSIRGSGMLLHRIINHFQSPIAEKKEGKSSSL